MHVFYVNVGVLRPYLKKSLNIDNTLEIKRNSDIVMISKQYSWRGVNGMNEKEIQFEEKILKAKNGMGMLILTVALYLGSSLPSNNKPESKEKPTDKEKKQLLLRLSPSLWENLVA